MELVSVRESTNARIKYNIFTLGIISSVHPTMISYFKPVMTALPAEKSG
jgi:hypothetical protein